MNRTCFFILAVFFGVPAASFADPTIPANPETPRGYVLVEEEFWLAWAEEPSRQLEKARERYLNQDTPKAVSELRKVEGYFKATARHAGLRNGVALANSAREIEHLAHRIESHQVFNVDEIDKVSARALHSLSEYHYHKASEAWSHNDARRSGQFLQAASANLDHATSRVTQAVHVAAGEVTKDSKAIGHRMVKGASWVADEVTESFNAFGRQLEKVNKAIETHW